MRIGNRESGIVMLLALVMAGSVAAQQPQPAPQPQEQPAPGPGGMMRRQADVERHRAEVEERFGRIVKTELGLNDQQMERVRTSMRANQDRRRELMRRDMDVRRGIHSQMQPGVQANNDSLNRLLEQASRLQVERAESDQQLMRDLNFLTPVQRARFVMLTQRFEGRMREIREHREREGQREPPRPMRPRGGRM